MAEPKQTKGELSITRTAFWCGIALVAVILIQAYYPLAPLTLVFSVLNTYLILILQSWPAVFLIICIFILYIYKDAIDLFLSK